MLPVTAEMVQQLSVITDAPRMECKKALIACDGDMERAKEYIRCPPKAEDLLIGLLRRVEQLEKLAGISSNTLVNMEQNSPSSPTVSELLIEGFGDGGFRAEHSLALAMADASPVLLKACQNAKSFLLQGAHDPEASRIIRELTDAIHLASTAVSRNAS